MSSIGDFFSGLGSGIADGFTSLGSGLVDLGSSIVDGLSGFLTDIYDAIIGLPSLILDGIKSIFIPDYDEIQDKFYSFLDELKMKFSFNTDFFESILSGEQPVTDIEGDYTVPGVGEFHLTFFDSQYFVDGVTYFRPFIRGFLVLMMGFYQIHMLLSFIRQDAGIVTGKAVSMELGLEHPTTTRAKRQNKKGEL